MLDFMHLTWIRPAFDVNNISPFAVHPLLWVVAISGLTLALIVYRDTSAAWPLTMAITVLAYPRLLVYELMSCWRRSGNPGLSLPVVPLP